MTPFVIQSISPEHVALGHHIDDIPEFFLPRPQSKVDGGPAEEEAILLSSSSCLRSGP